MPPPPKRRAWMRGLASAVVVTALAGGVVWLRLRGEAVPTLHAERGLVRQTVVSSGRVLPPAEVRLGALVVGTVREVTVAEGDAVVEGQLLLRLDDADAVAAVAQAEAAIEQARAGQFELARLDGPAAAAALRQAQASLEQAQLRVERQRELFGGGVSTRSSLDDAETSLVLAKAQHEAAQLQVKAASAGGSRAALAAAGVAQARAQLARAQAQLDHMTVKAPVDGVVVDRQIEPGDAVVVGSRLFVLTRRGATRLVIEPDERNLALLALGQPAVASAEAFPEERFEAKVEFLAPVVDPQRGTIEVHLAVPSPPAYLRPHMTVSVEIQVGERADALTVPLRAVRGLATDAPYVLAVEDGRIVRRPVAIGLRGDERVEIRDGLSEADALVGDETVDLDVGTRVRPRPR